MSRKKIVLGTKAVSQNQLSVRSSYDEEKPGICGCTFMLVDMLSYAIGRMKMSNNLTRLRYYVNF